jgi:hypothetical protein
VELRAAGRRRGRRQARGWSLLSSLSTAMVEKAAASTLTTSSTHPRCLPSAAAPPAPPCASNFTAPDRRNPPSVGAVGRRHGLRRPMTLCSSSAHHPRAMSSTSSPRSSASARSQRLWEPQLPRRCTKGMGKLLETLLFCSTGVSSLPLHIADAGRESVADSVRRGSHGGTSIRH